MSNMSRINVIEHGQHHNEAVRRPTLHNPDKLIKTPSRLGISRREGDDGHL
uniref:Uncharacterized protein n=1 Tax=Kalanchoe fedtschenkoi TaxID=63787 RepID=A0A7N0UYQ8_KALFE